MSKSAQQNSGRFSHESNVKQAFQLCEVLGGYACEAVCDHERRPLFWKNPGAVVQDSECRDRPLPLKIDLYIDFGPCFKPLSKKRQLAKAP